MSAIGEYVHYRAFSYLKNNPRIEGSEMISYAQRKIQQQLNKNKSGMNLAEKERLLNIINAFMGRESNLTEKEKTEIEKRYSQLENNFLQTYQNHLVDRISGKVSQIVEGKSIKESKQSVAISIEALDKFKKEYNALLKRLQSSINSGKLDSVKQRTFKEAYNKLVQRLTDLKDLRDKAYSYVDIQTGKDIPNDFKKIKGLAKTKSFEGKDFIEVQGQFKSIQKTFNDALNETGLAITGASLAQGTLFELITTEGADFLLDFATDKVNASLVSLSREGNKGKDAWIEVDDLATNWSNTAITEKHGDVVVQLHKNYSQGKVDVDVAYSRPTEDNLVNLKISAKSYSQLSHLKIVDNTTSWAILSHEDSVYRKAFLNIISKHNQDLKKIYNITQTTNADYHDSLKKSELASRDRLKTQKKDAIIMFKLLAAYKALTGDVFEREAANIFLVNDVSSQKIYLLEMQDIFNSILLQLAKNSSALSNYFDYDITPTLENGYVNNWDNNSANARVAKILNQVHKQKIQVIFKGSQEKFSNMGVSIDSFGKITNNLT